jgi:hypothetical protein
MLQERAIDFKRHKIDFSEPEDLLNIFKNSLTRQ